MTLKEILGRFRFVDVEELTPKKRKDYDFNWKKQADDILRKSGNHTLDLIHGDFERDPENEAMAVPGLPYYFVTPVMNRRYSVIWRRSEAGPKKVATVSAVVPVRFAGEAEGMTLKQRVESAVHIASDGRAQLDF